MGSTITDAILPSGSYTPWNGPVIDGNDNLYIVAEDDNNANNLSVFKSTNDGSTWSRIDTAGQPDIGSAIQSFALFQDGTTLHIAAMNEDYSAGMGSAQDIFYYTFHTSDAGGTADTWQISESVTTTDNSFHGQVDIAVRSDGDVILAHAGDLNAQMGTDYPSVQYSRREGGSWTTKIQVSQTTSNNYYGPAICLGTSDSVHFTYARDGNSLEVVTLDSSNNLSTHVLQTGFWNPFTMRRPISWDNSGTQQIMVIEDDGRLARFEEDGSGDIAAETGQSEIGPGFSIAELAWGVTRTDDGEVRVYGGNLGDNTGGPDLYTSSSTEGDDADWGNTTEIEDGVDVSYNSDGQGSVSVNTFSRGGSEVTGIVWADATVGNFIYTEVVAETEFFAEQASEKNTASDAQFGPNTGTADDIIGSLDGPTRNAGLHRDGANLYVIQAETETAGTRSVPQVLKSLDDGANWGYFDNHADNSSTTKRCDHISSTFDGTYIGIIWYSGDNEYSYSAYDTSTETWIVEQETIATDATSSANQGGTAIGVRPTSSEVIVAYVSTTNYTISAKIRPNLNGGTGFGSEISVHNTASVLHSPTLDIDPANDDVHICWVGATTNDNLYHRRIDGTTDTLGTLQTSSVSGVNSNQLPGDMQIYHDWLYHMWVDETPNLHVRLAQLADVPSWNDITVSSSNIATTNGGDWIPASLNKGDNQLILTWIRDSDNEIMWAVGPKFGAEHASGTSITDTHGWLAGVVEAQSARLHLLGIQSDVSASDTAATFRDLNLKTATGGTDGSTYSDIEPVGDLTSQWQFGVKRFWDHIFEVPESSTEPYRLYHIRVREVTTDNWYYDVWVSMDRFHWFNLANISSAEPQTNLFGRPALHFDGSIAHLVQGGLSSNNSTSDGDVDYWQWNPTTEQWDVEAELIVSEIRFNRPGVTVQGRSDGTVVCAYAVQTSGVTEIGIDYKIRSGGGTWGSANTLVSAGTSEVWGHMTSVLGSSDRVHFFYILQTDDDLYHRSLSSGDSLDTQNTVASIPSILQRVAPAAVMDGTTIGVMYERATRLRGFKTATSGANPTWSSQANVDDSVFADMHVIDNNEHVGALFFIDSEFHTVIPRGTRPSALDLYRDTRSGTTWGTDEDSGLNTLGDVYQIYGNHAYSEAGASYLMVIAEEPGVTARIHHVELAPPPTVFVDQALESDTASEALYGPPSQANADLYGWNSRVGPGPFMFEIGTDLWTVEPEDESDAPREVPRVLQSTDDGSTWTQHGLHAHNPHYPDGNADFELLASATDGRYIAIAWLAGWTGDIDNSEGKYSVFDTQTTSWTVENEQIGTTFRNVTGGGMEVRPGSGEVVFAYESAPTGSSSNRIDVQIRPDIAGGAGFGSRILLAGPDGTTRYGADLAINPENDDVHVVWPSSSNLYHRVVRGSDDSLSSLQTVAQSNIESDATHLVEYHGWLYHAWIDTSAIIHVRRAKMEETPTWTTAFSSSAASKQTALWSWFSLIVGNEQLVLTWVRDSDSEIMWSQGPFFNFENASGTAITNDSWFGQVLTRRSNRLRLMGVEQDDDSTNLAATFQDLDIRVASGGPEGDALFEWGAASFPDDNPPFVAFETWETMFVLEESSVVPRVFHTGFLQGLDLGGSGSYKWYWWISMDGLSWFLSPAPGTDWQNSSTDGGHLIVDVDYDGTIAHVAGASASTDTTTEDGEVVYGQYDPIDEEWDVTEELISNIYDSAHVKIAVRSDDTVVAAYLDATNGSSSSNLRYKIRSSGGSWGSESTIATGPIGQGTAVVLGASDRTHFIYYDGNDALHRSLSSGDTLDTENTVDSSTNSVLGILYDGTDIGVIYSNGTRSRGFRSAVSGASPTWNSEQSVDDSSWANMAGISDANRCFYVVEHPTESGEWFAVSMPRNAVPHDIFLDQRTDTWQADFDSGEDSMSASGGQADPIEFWGNLSYVEAGSTYLLVGQRGGGGEVDDTYVRIQRVPISVTPGGVTWNEETATESDTAYDVVLTPDPVFSGEEASESDVAFEVLLGFETAFIAEQASESDVAYEVELSVNAPALDASTGVTFTIDLSAGSADSAETVAPTPIVGQGTIKRGHYRAKIYRPSHNIIRRN